MRTGSLLSIRSTGCYEICTYTSQVAKAGKNFTYVYPVNKLWISRSHLSQL